jgi:hypothetical protein
LGRRRFDIRFWRDGKNTLFKVLTGKRDSVEWKSVALPPSAVPGSAKVGEDPRREANPKIYSSKAVDRR